MIVEIRNIVTILVILLVLLAGLLSLLVVLPIRARALNRKQQLLLDGLGWFVTVGALVVIHGPHEWSRGELVLLAAVAVVWLVPFVVHYRRAAPRPRPCASPS